MPVLSAATPTLGCSEPGNVIDQYGDVLFRQRLRGHRHVAVNVGPALCLEAMQLRAQIFTLLPCETRNVLLAQQGRAVSLDAVELLGKCRSSGGVGRVGLVRRWRCLLGGKIGREIVHVGVAEVCCQRGHLRILAVALPKLEKLGGNELCRLLRERRHDGIGRIARGPVARDADLRLLPTRLDVGARCGHDPNEER